MLHLVLRLSKQLVVVSAAPASSEDKTQTTASDIFKKPPTPAAAQKVHNKPVDTAKQVELRDNDVYMKSPSSVSTMDLSIEAESKSSKTSSSKSVARPSSPARPPPTPVNGLVKQPMITVHVVQDDEPKISKKSSPEKEKSKQPPSSKKTASQHQKKGTISEDTKMKIRDTIFASMLAKQKGEL